MKTLIVLLLCTLMAGCGSTPAVIRYYMLDDPTHPMSAGEKQTSVVLKHLRLPEYLRQDGLVMQLGPNQLQLSSQHLWAQSMSTGIETVLLKHVNASQNLFQLRSMAEPDDPNSQYHLHIQIVHLLIEQHNAVKLQARYWLTDSRTETRLLSADSDISVPLTADGYDHAVSQMRQALVRFSQQICAEVDTLLSSH